MQELGDSHHPDNVLKIQFCVVPNGLTTSQICVLQHALLQAAYMLIQRLNSVFQYVLQHTIQMIAQENVFRDVHKQMDHWVLLVIIQPEFAKKIVKSPMLLLILKH